MERYIRAEDYQDYLDLMREERPGRVYILYRRSGDACFQLEYDRWGLYFSYWKAMEDCICRKDEDCVNYRLELNDPEPDGSARFVGMFFLRQYPGKDPVLYDAVLGYETVRQLLGTAPEYHPVLLEDEDR